MKKIIFLVLFIGLNSIYAASDRQPNSINNIHVGDTIKIGFSGARNKYKVVSVGADTITVAWNKKENRSFKVINPGIPMDKNADYLVGDFIKKKFFIEEAKSNATKRMQDIQNQLGI